MCIVCGKIKDDSGTIDAPIGRHPADRKKMAVTEKNSRSAVTHWRVLERFSGYTLVECKLETGRTHQIRAHLAYLGKPVLGDIKYGNRKMNERTGTKTQALCAVRISFLDIPEENTLHYLSGKVIKLKDPQIVKQFDALDKNKSAPAEEK